MKNLLLISALTFSLLNILKWPVNKFEWMMLENPEMNLPLDSNQGFYPIFALLPTILLILISIIFFRRVFKNKLYLLSIVLLVAFWAYKYMPTLMVL